MIKTTKKLMATGLVMAMMAATGCNSANNGDETKNREDTEQTAITMTRNEIAEVSDIKVENVNSYCDFSVSLLQNSYYGGNTLVSPLSVMTALGMTENGAANATLAEMENTMGMSLEDTNNLMYYFEQNYLGEQISMANNIWVNSSRNIELQEEYRQKVFDYYGNGVVSEEFGDETINHVNQFVDEHTAHRIPTILEYLDPDAAMILVNALTFDGVWANPFEPDRTYQQSFFAENGEIRMDMMHGSTYGYISGDNETGFVKPYEGGYSFVALLPDEGITIEDYINSLSGDEIQNMISSRQHDEVFITVPQFTAEFDIELNQALDNMGMPTAFTDAADFTNMATTGDEIELLRIGRVIHKTFISVDEEGTEAAAATVVMMDEATSCEPDPDPLFVVLDRPFVYMIIETNTNMPVFIGAYTGE